MRQRRNKAARLRTAVECLPEHTRRAMLEGIESNRIIVGAYTDRDGGVCPMLAAHRNGGRTSFASFASAWDDFTGAKRRISRRATRREIGALRSYLEMSLLADETRGESVSTLAARIRSERREAAERAAAEPPPHVPPDAPAGDRFRTPELRLRRRWSWMRPARSLDVYEATLAAAAEQHAERAAEEILEPVDRDRSEAPV